MSIVYVIGDINADISDINSLCSRQSYCSVLSLSSEVCLPVDSYTYVSEAWNTTS